MNLLIIILLVLAGLLVLLLFIALFMRKDHFVKREIIIRAPVQKVFDYVKLLKNQDEFNEHAKAGEERIKNYRGTDGTVGFVYSWKGDKKAGEGEKEIISLTNGKKVEMEIRFVRPMKVTSRILLEMEQMNESDTKLAWSNAGTLKFPVNIFIPFLERSLPGSMDASLNKLKAILEK